jgi:hypothetical protein
MINQMSQTNVQNSNRQRPRSQSRGRYQEGGPLCYYHWRYHEKAIK